MAPKEQDSAKNAAASERKPMLKWLIMGGVLLVFLALEVVIALFFVNKLKPEDQTLKTVQEEQKREEEMRKKQTEMGATLDKAIDVTVNIAETNGERFLKAAVQLEWDSADPLLGAEIVSRLPKIKNIIIDILSSRSMSELMTVDGKKNIRDAIVADVNAILPTEVNGQSIGKVRRAFFVEFIIQ